MARDVPYPTVYGFWTNPDCAAKTALSFHMATTYAELFPNKAVVVIDMCPHANLSATLLTKTTQRERRPGAEVVRDMQDNNKAQDQIPKTVAGYLTARLINKSVPVEKFLVNVMEDGYNPHVPSNLELVCGDSNLDLLAPRLSARAHELPTQAIYSSSIPFKDVHYYLRDFIQQLAEYYANLEEPLHNKELVVFIDTNPALSIYTEIALCAMTELVLPVSTDTFAYQAVNSMYHQLYGLYPTNSAAARAFERDAFANKVKQYCMSLPAITAIIHNRNPLLKTGRYKAVFNKAQKAIAAEQCAKLFQGYLKADESGEAELKRVFAAKKYANESPIECTNITEFVSGYTAAMMDMHSTGVAAQHSGFPLWVLLGQANRIDGRFKAINFKETVPSLMKDLLYAMEVMLGATQWADKDAQAMKRLEKIANPFSIWKWMVRICSAVLCCAVLCNWFHQPRI